MAAACAFYLAWWSVAFNPSKNFPAAEKAALFALTAAAGIAGVAFIARSLSVAPVLRRAAGNIAIAAAGAALYVALLFFTSRALHRPVTTELLLITAWAAAELCAVNSSYRAAALEAPASIALSAAVIVSAAAALALYLAYFKLEARKAFVTGMIPLVLFAAVMAAQAAALHFSNR